MSTTFPGSGSPAILGRERLDNRLFLAGGLAWAAGLIHVQATIEHLEEYVPYAVFFVVLAAMQFAWGLAVWRRAVPRLLWAGCAVSVAVALVWLASRTTGLPIGPQRWSPEPVGLVDAIATADEIVLAMLVVSQFGVWRAVSRSLPFRALTSIAGIALVSLSGLTFMLGHAH